MSVPERYRIKEPDRQEGKKMEDKHKICEQLTKTLRLTRECDDFLRLYYDEYNEVVRVAYISEPDRFINVAADSGIAMIRDIMRGMGIYA